MKKTCKVMPKVIEKVIDSACVLTNFIIGAILPPISEDLLIWLKGDGTDTQKLDSWEEPDKENFTMLKSACVTLDGVSDDGETSKAHGTIISSEGTATVTYSGTTLSFSTTGTFYNVTFSDGTHYRIAEGVGDGTNLTSFSDDGTETITWTGTPANLWGGTQDTYHGNRGDWWEIDGDLIRYPYPVAGFTTYHEGGTFNLCETSYSPEEFPIGTSDGTDTITMLADHGALLSQGLLDTSTASYVHPTVSISVGTVRDLLFEDGTLVQLREGTGTVIHNSLGAVVGTLTATLPTFWDGEPMVSPEVIAAEAASTSGNYLTDGKGHGLPMTQQDWGTLGAESVDNGEFIYWADPTVPDDWNKAGTYDANNYVEEDAKGIHLVSDGAYTGLNQNTGIEVGKVYAYTILGVEQVQGKYAMNIGGISVPLTGGGDFSGTVTAITTIFAISRGVVGSPCETYVKSMSLREVNQVMNKNKQYFFSGALPWDVDSGCDSPEMKVYKEPLSDTEDVLVKRDDLCGSFKGCDDVMLIGTAGTTYGYTASFGDLYIKEFEDGLISEIYADTDDDLVTLTMNSGFTPEHPYLQLGVGGNLAILTYDAPTHTYTGTDATLTAYLSGNVGGSTCINLTGTA